MAGVTQTEFMAKYSLQKKKGANSPGFTSCEKNGSGKYWMFFYPDHFKIVLGAENEPGYASVTSELGQAVIALTAVHELQHGCLRQNGAPCPPDGNLCEELAVVGATLAEVCSSIGEKCEEYCELKAAAGGQPTPEQAEQLEELGQEINDLCAAYAWQAGIWENEPTPEQAQDPEYKSTEEILEECLQHNEGEEDPDKHIPPEGAAEECGVSLPAMPPGDPPNMTELFPQCGPCNDEQAGQGEIEPCDCGESGQQGGGGQ